MFQRSHHRSKWRNKMKVFSRERCSFRTKLEKSSKASNEDTTPQETANKMFQQHLQYFIKQPLLLFSLIFQIKVALLSSWNYSLGGHYKISKPHFLQTITLEMKQPMTIRSCCFYKLWLNGFRHDKQKKFPTTKSLLWQHKLVQHLSELFFVLCCLLKIYLEKYIILY